MQFFRAIYFKKKYVVLGAAVLAAIGGVEPMMKGHMGIALNVGVTPDELRHLFIIVEKQIGHREADAGRIVLNEVLQSKGLTHRLYLWKMG